MTVATLMMIVLLSVALQTASPPVSGVNMLAYMVMYAQLDIPKSFLVVALLEDVLFGFFYSPMNQAFLQLELGIEAKRTGQMEMHSA